MLVVCCPSQLGSRSPVCSLGALCCVCGVLGHLAPVHRSAPSVRCVACAISSATRPLFAGVLAQCVVFCSAVSWATWLLLGGVPARCIVLRLQFPEPLGSSSPVCLLCALCCVRGVLGHWPPVHPWARSLCCSVCCVCGVLGHLASVHRCACLVRCVACEVSWCSCLLFAGLRVRCPGLLSSHSTVCPLGAVCCVCGVLGFLTLVCRCAC